MKTSKLSNRASFVPMFGNFPTCDRHGRVLAIQMADVCEPAFLATQVAKGVRADCNGKAMLGWTIGSTHLIVDLR